MYVGKLSKKNMSCFSVRHYLRCFKSRFKNSQAAKKKKFKICKARLIERQAQLIENQILKNFIQA